MKFQRIAVVGNGGREHALAWRFELEGNFVSLVSADEALQTDADLFVIGPEQPLVDGLADELRAQGKLVFGPSQSHALLEGSKVFMKMCLNQAGIWTAPWAEFSPGDEYVFVETMRETAGSPGWNSWVIKTDYLAGGKGVLVTDDVEVAIADGLTKLEKGSIVVEQKLVGREVSFFAVVSGDGSFCFLPSACDSKRAYDGDEGPNTGGMGSYSPINDDVSLEVRTEIVQRLLSIPQLQGYTGVLFGGLMVNDDGVYVLEFNIRFGDPETQSILPRLDVALGEILAEAARGETLPPGELAAGEFCVTVVLASEGYPADPILGREVTDVLDAAAHDEDVIVFPAGLAEVDGRLVTTGGRVLCVSALGPTLAVARQRAYATMSDIGLEGGHYRSDIAAP